MVGGCATIFSGTTQTIHVRAIDAETEELLAGCACVVSDGSGGEYVMAGNPGAVTVKRGGGMLSFACKKRGYRQLNTLAGDSFNAVSVVNILFWPGALVDACAGAYAKYPSYYVIRMEPKGE